jgi:hypothetical protein
MISDDSHPPRIVGGGINTGESQQPVVVTQMLGVGSDAPTREEDLRAVSCPLIPCLTAMPPWSPTSWFCEARSHRPMRLPN